MARRPTLAAARGRYDEAITASTADVHHPQLRGNEKLYQEPFSVPNRAGCLDRHDKSYTIKVYADAPHGWLNDTMPGRYRRAQAEAAWALQLAFLERVLDRGYNRARRVQIYECDHSADYDFTKNVRME